MHDRNQDVIALTHVCQAWRKIFASCPSAWTDLDCENADKTRVYLERSKSLPVDLRLERVEELSPLDPFFQVIPHTISRLRSLAIYGTPANLQDIVSQLSRPAPLLRSLTIEVDCGCSPQRGPAITTTLFNGDLSSLRELRLKCVTTALPWRNMVNLTSFALGYTLVGDFPIKHLLDFLKSAPRLRKVRLHNAIPTSGAQNGRLVSLECLKRMDIIGGGPSSLLLDHLLIPVGARLEAKVDLLSPIGNHPQKFIDNLRNLPDFTSILLVSGGKLSPRIEFSGPNGQVIISPNYSSPHTPCLSLGSLVQFDTSKTERLEIIYGSLPASDSLRQTLLPMRGLCTLVLERCGQPHPFINALDPSRCSTGALVCPKLEELIIECEEEVDIERVIRMAKARALRGARLKLVRIASKDKFWEIGGDGDGGGCGGPGYVATL